MKKSMTFLITFCIILVFSFTYLALTKPKQMPFIGHFFDKIVYGSLYYLNRPDESYIYTTNSNINLKIHIFRPEKIETKSSLLLFHGGGWAFGSSYSLFKMCRDISDQGILCASAEYRLALKHNSKVKDSMLDAEKAFEWLIDNSGKLNIDENSIMVGGGSSGGHLAASLAMIPNKNNKTYENIKALIFFNPAINTSFFDSGYQLPENTHERRKRFWFYMKNLFEGQSVELSPSNHIKENLPPSIIFHGTSDRTIPIDVVEEFTKEMTEKGNNIKLLKWDNKGHQFYRWDKEAYPEVMSELINFIKGY